MIHRGRPLYFNEVNKQSFDSDESFYRFEQRQIPTESSDCYVVMKSPLENSNEEFHFKYEKMSPKKTAIDNAFIPKSNDVRIFPQKFGDRVVFRKLCRIIQVKFQCKPTLDYPGVGLWRFHCTAILDGTVDPR